MYGPDSRCRWIPAWYVLARGIMLAALLSSSAPAMERRGARVVEYKGDRFLALKSVASMYGSAIGVEGKDIVLRHAEGRFTCTQATRRAHFERKMVWLHSEPVRLRRRWSVTEADVESVIGPLLRPGPCLARQRADIVMLDPGHGGRDEGARGRGKRVEKQLTLELARRVQKKLGGAGCRILLTRTDDRYVALEERSDAARERRADVFVSLHFNQAGNTNAAGIEVYALTAPGQPSTLDAAGEPPPLATYRGHAYQGASTVLGFTLHAALTDRIPTEDRGLRRARFAVLRNAPCPAALVECGFLSNPEEGAAIETEARMDALADALAGGLQSYLDAVRAARARAAGY